MVQDRGFVYYRNCYKKRQGKNEDKNKKEEHKIELLYSNYISTI